MYKNVCTIHLIFFMLFYNYCLSLDPEVFGQWILGDDECEGGDKEFGGALEVFISALFQDIC